MTRPHLAAALLAGALLIACTDNDSLPGPSGILPAGNPPGTSGGDTTSAPGDTTSAPIDSAAAADPVDNGTWTSPDGTTPAIQGFDPGTFTPAGDGTASTFGSSTALLFNTSDAGRYGIGTCGPKGFWTDPDGNVFGPNNPNCLSYRADGLAGRNGTGQCTTSQDGFPGLWIDPGGNETSPFHSECLRVGAAGTSLELSFGQQAQLFATTDASGGRGLNLHESGLVVAQLVYDGNTGTTSGAGILLGTDDGLPARIWTIYFGQPALDYTVGFPNGDLIGAITGSGLEIVACSTEIGCSVVALRVTLGS
jgi:hypothetical protein